MYTRVDRPRPLGKTSGPGCGREPNGSHDLAVAGQIGERYLPAPVADARADRIGQLERLADGLTTGREALELAPAMLGAKGPRRYLAVHNNAEVRGTGGLVGAYAVLRAADGRLSLERVGTNQDFRTAPAPVVDLGPEFSSRYDREFARGYWSAAVLTPDWPRAAQIMAGLWRAQGGGELDGVLGVDPVAMAQILAVTGRRSRRSLSAGWTNRASRSSPVRPASSGPAGRPWSGRGDRAGRGCSPTGSSPWSSMTSWRARSRASWTEVVGL